MSEQPQRDEHLAALYSTWTTDMLLDVVDSPEEYLPEAVLAAQDEIDSRRLSPDQLSQAREEQELRHKKDPTQKWGATRIQRSIQTATISAVDFLNPVDESERSNDWYINIISLLLLGLGLYHVYLKFHVFSYILADIDRLWDPSWIEYLMPMVLMPIAAILLLRRMKSGWVLTVVYSAYMATLSIALLIHGLFSEPLEVITDELMGQVTLMVYLASAAVFASIVWALCREQTRDIYRVERRQMSLVLFIGIGVACALSLRLLKNMSF